MGIRGKLILYTALVAMAVASGFSWYFMRYQRGTIRERFIRKGQILADSFGRELEQRWSSMDVGKICQTLGSLKQDEEVLYQMVLDSQGLMLSDGQEHTPERGQVPKILFARTIAHQTHMRVQTAIEGRTLHVGRAIRAAEGDLRGFLVFGLNLASETELVKDAMGRTLFLIVGLVMLAIPLSILFARSFTDPILKLVAVTQAVGIGRIHVRSEHRSADEIGELSNAFNKMLDETQRLMREIRSARAFSNSLLDSMPLGLVAIDGDGWVLSANPEFRRMLGDQPYLGSRLTELVSIPALDAAIESVLSGEKRMAQIEARYATARKVPRITELEITVAPVRAGDSTRVNLRALDREKASPNMVVIFNDVTERKLAAERFQVLMKAAPDPIVIADQSNRITEVNAEAESVFGYSRDELVGEPLVTLIPELGDVATASKEITDSSSALNPALSGVVELTGRRKTGDQFPVEVRQRSLVTSEGIFVTSIIRDTTEQKRLLTQLENNIRQLKQTQGQLVQSGKMAAVGELSAGVAHEINNPLTGVLTYAILLQEKLSELPAEIRAQLPKFEKRLNLIREGAERCKSIVDNLLHFSRQSLDERQVLNPEDVIARTFDLIDVHLRHKRVRLNWRRSEEQIRIWGSLIQLQQVLTNIVLNAVQAMDEGGTITVGVSEADGYCRIEVADDGPGIPEDIRDKIFDPFFTTKEVGEGTGLGLSIAYRIVERHEGRIEILSSVGGGATFRIYLPLAEAKEIVS